MLDPVTRHEVTMKKSSPSRNGLPSKIRDVIAMEMIETDAIRIRTVSKSVNVRPPRESVSGARKIAMMVSRTPDDRSPVIIRKMVVRSTPRKVYA